MQDQFKALEKHHEGLKKQEEGLDIVEVTIKDTTLEKLTPVFQGLSGYGEEEASTSGVTKTTKPGVTKMTMTLD